MGIKVLVTGGAGFIGSHLVDKLIERGDRVVIIDNLSTGKKENLNPGAKFYEADIQSPEISDIFMEEKPEFVFHLAAIPRVPISVEKPVETSKTNIIGTVNIFKAAADNKIRRVIFSSSSSVYGDQNKLPFKEDMTPNPISPYGLQKLVGEKFANLFGKLYGISIVCLRYFNVYGPRIDFNSDYSLVLGKFLRLYKQNKPLTIYGTGNQTRSFTYVDDVVRANILAAESEKLRGGEVINIGSEKSYSINYLADIIGGKKQYLPPRKGDPLHTQADIELAKKLLNWVPEVDFEDGVERTKKWFEEMK